MATTTEQRCTVADQVALIMEGAPVAVEPAVPTVEEALAVGPTSSSGGAHDEGDPGDEGFWGATGTSADVAKVGAGTAGDALSITGPGPPAVAEQGTLTAASTAEMGLRRPVRAQQRPRRAPLQAAIMVCSAGDGARPFSGGHRPAS